MSWAEKTGKPGAGGGSGIKVVEEENDFPISKPDYMRIGSAHAVERNGDRKALENLLKKFADIIHTQFGQDPATNTIVIEEK